MSAQSLRRGGAQGYGAATNLCETTRSSEGRDRMEIGVLNPDVDLNVEMTNNQPEEPLVIGGGVTATWRVPMAKAQGIPQTIELAFQIGGAVAGGVALNVVANIITDWLMGRFKGRAEKLRIERQEVEFEAGAVKRIVLETITRETDR